MNTTKIELNKLHPFENHPYKVQDNEEMDALVESMDKLRSLIRKHGLKPIVFHSLRHSSTSLKLKISGGNIKAVQGDTGHAQARMVTDVYAHIMTDDRKNLAQKVNDHLLSAEPQETSGGILGLTQVQLLQDSPDLAGPLLKMHTILNGKNA